MPEAEQAQVCALRRVEGIRGSGQQRPVGERSANVGPRGTTVLEIDHATAAMSSTSRIKLAGIAARAHALSKLDGLVRPEAQYPLVPVLGFVVITLPDRAITYHRPPLSLSPWPCALPGEVSVTLGVERRAGTGHGPAARRIRVAPHERGLRPPRGDRLLAGRRRQRRPDRRTRAYARDLLGLVGREYVQDVALGVDHDAPSPGSVVVEMCTVPARACSSCSTRQRAF